VTKIVSVDEAIECLVELFDHLAEHMPIMEYEEFLVSAAEDIDVRREAQNNARRG
jgi:hypothetical protein